MIFDIDDVIPFSKRHKGETIRQIIRYDSGYLRDLFLKDERVSFSRESFAEICRLTQGHYDNWEKPNKETKSIFLSISPISPHTYTILIWEGLKKSTINEFFHRPFELLLIS